MKSRELKAVIIGAGWAGEGHTKALQHYGVDVVAICARKAEVVEKVASQLGVSQASTDWQKSLLDEKDSPKLATKRLAHRFGHPWIWAGHLKVAWSMQLASLAKGKS